MELWLISYGWGGSMCGVNVVTPDSLFGWNNYLETFQSIKTLSYHSLSATSIQTMSFTITNGTKVLLHKFNTSMWNFSIKFKSINICWSKYSISASSHCLKRQKVYNLYVKYLQKETHTLNLWLNQRLKPTTDETQLNLTLKMTTFSTWPVNHICSLNGQ